MSRTSRPLPDPTRGRPLYEHRPLSGTAATRRTNLPHPAPSLVRGKPLRVSLDHSCSPKARLFTCQTALTRELQRKGDVSSAPTAAGTSRARTLRRARRRRKSSGFLARASCCALPLSENLLIGTLALTLTAICFRDSACEMNGLTLNLMPPRVVTIRQATLDDGINRSNDLSYLRTQMPRRLTRCR